MTPANQRTWIPLLLLVAAVLFTYFYDLQPGYPWGGDAALLVMHARNLATGQPYARTPYVYDDEAWMEGTPSFPPGLPLLLAPVYRWKGLDLDFMRRCTVVLLALALIPVFYFMRQWLSPWWALAAVAFTATNRFSLTMLMGILSEPLYLCVSFAALVAAGWAYRTGRTESSPWLCGLLVGVLAGYTDWTRSIGITLMAGVALYDLYRCRRVTRFLIAAALACGAMIVASNLILHSDVHYRTQFRPSLALALVHWKQYVTGSMELWLGIPGRWPRIGLWLATTGLALHGLRLKLRREGPGPVEFYLPCYFAVLGFYWIANTRYLVPIMPVYFLYAFYGLAEVWTRLARPVPRLAAGAVLLLMALAVTRGIAYADRTPMADGVHTATYREALDYIRSRTPAGARIASDSARFLALFTGRSSLYYPVQEDLPAIAAFLQRMHADRVLINKRHDEDRQKLLPALALGSWDTEFENSEYTLYRRR